MFESINAWLFTLSTMECVSLFFVFIGLFLYWNSPIIRLIVIHNKVFGDGKLQMTQPVIGIITECVWYYGVYYFVSSYLSM
ncbi:hypothetical protein ZPAH1_orf00380 [Aeromonas phage ZPAH1]|nr:hypothetical protein ASwh1_335 [Aeromonas phage Aswh_1]QQG34142.1 hypothetical protein ZPAH1_orf00380 [Aeromonas phage ZPAH1]